MQFHCTYKFTKEFKYQPEKYLEQWTTPTVLVVWDSARNKKEDHLWNWWDSRSKPDLEFNLWILCKWFPISIGFREFKLKSISIGRMFLFEFICISIWFTSIGLNSLNQIAVGYNHRILSKFKYEFQSNKKDFSEIRWFDCGIIRIWIIISNKVTDLVLLTDNTEKNKKKSEYNWNNSIKPLRLESSSLFSLLIFFSVWS